MAAPASHSTVRLTALLPVLISSETVVISSDLGNPVRYGLGGLVLVVLLAVISQLGRTLRATGTDAASPTV